MLQFKVFAAFIVAFPFYKSYHRFLRVQNGLDFFGSSLITHWKVLLCFVRKRMLCPKKSQLEKNSAGSASSLVYSSKQAKKFIDENLAFVRALS